MKKPLLSLAAALLMSGMVTAQNQIYLVGGVQGRDINDASMPHREIAPGTEAYAADTPGETIGGATLHNDPSTWASTVYIVSIVWDYETITEGSMEATVTMPNGSVTPYTGKIGEESPDDATIIPDNAFQILFPYPGLSVLGTYTVSLPEGCVYIDGIPNSAQDLKFTIQGTSSAEYMPDAQMVYPTSPYLSFLFNIEMTWNGEYIIFADGAEDGNAFISFAGGNFEEVMAYIHSLPISDEGGENLYGKDQIDVLYIDVPWEVVPLGEYGEVAILIPAGLVKNSAGALNPAQVVTINLMESVYEAQWSVPDGSRISLNDAIVSVEWDGYEISPLSGGIIARNSKSREDIPLEFGKQLTVRDDYSKLLIDLSTLAAAEYEVIIPEAAILLEKGEDTAINGETMATYTLKGESGVAGIETEDNISVVNLQGIRVLENGNADALLTLPAGTYIVNGKKTILK